MRRSSARVLVVGLGGIGCPALLALTRSGVGTLGLCDDDEVDRSNLHRQILFDDADAQARAPKVETAARALAFASCTIDVRLHRRRMLPDCALELVRQYDLVLEGSDNYATKFLAADACALAGVPIVQASAIRWVATALAVSAGGRPCYRCIFEDVPRAGGQSCAEAGVMGPVVGIIAAVQVDLALDLIDSIGSDRSPVAGQLVAFDGRTETMRRRTVSAREDCALCGDRPAIVRIDPSAYAEPDSCIGRPRYATRQGCS